MATEVSDRLTPAGRSPSAVVAGLTGRRAARSGVVWGYVFGAFVSSSALAYASAYKTPKARAELVRTFGSNAGVSALVGPARQLQTVAGFTAWRSLVILSVAGGVWGLLTATRLLRGEEEAGRWELLLAGRTTRRQAAAQALAGLGAGVVVMWAVTAAVTAVVGRSSKVQIAAPAALFFAVALVSGAAMFAAVGAVTSQLATTRRQAAGLSGAALGVSFGLRMVADSGTGLGWLRWASPLGWVEELRPLTAPRPWPLVPIAGLTVLLAGASVYLAGQRDLEGSILPDHATGRSRRRPPDTAMGLALRLAKPALIGWLTAIAVMGAVLGLVARSGGTAIETSSSLTQVLTRLGARGTGAKSYLGLGFLILAILVTLVAAGQITAARDEEASGRLDHLIAQSPSRASWLAGRLVVATSALVVCGLTAGVTVWLGAASQDAGVGIGTLLQAGVNLVAPGLFVLGVGALSLGVSPRRSSSVVYGVLAWSVVVEVIGGVVKANRWLLDTSVFHQMAAAPAVTPDWTSTAVLLVLAVTAALLGGMALTRRDLIGA